MTYPTPFVVTRHAWVAAGTDRYGNEAGSWPVGTPVPVHGWSPPGPDSEQSSTARDAAVRDLDLFAPAGTAFAPRDRCTVDGLLFEVVGWPQDYTHGPFGWAAGVKVNLKRVEG